MLKGVNDSVADAKELLRLIKGIPSKINLIPFNPWPGSPYDCSTDAQIKKFADVIWNAGYSAPIRTPRGRDILAALRPAEIRKPAHRQARAAADGGDPGRKGSRGRHFRLGAPKTFTNIHIVNKG